MRIEAFSSPYEGEFYRLAGQASARALKNVLARVDAYGRTHGLPEIEYDRGRIETLESGHVGWSPELGSLANAIHRGLTPADWSWLSGQTRLALFLADILDSVDFDMEGRHPTVAAGQTFARGRLSVRGDRSRLRICDGDGRVLLERQRFADPAANVAWTTAERDNLVRLGSGRVVVTSNADWQTYWMPELEWYERAADRAQYRRKLEAYCALLEQQVPEYYLWMVTPLKELVLLKESPDGGERSSSFLLWPGHVHIAEHNAARNLATLVHEASHQYFHMALWLGAVVEPGAPNVYSPLRKCNRPLEVILLGYHAFGNAILALSKLPLGQWVRPEDKAECHAWLLEMVGGLGEQLEIHGERFLTGYGKALYLPLRRRLGDAGIAARRH